MRTERELRKKLRQLIYRHYQRKARALFVVRPSSCSFNHATSVLLPSGLPMRICLLQSESTDIVECSTVSHAESCPAFLFSVTRDQLRVSVVSGIRDPVVGPRDYRDVRLLLWVLNDPCDDTALLPSSRTAYVWRSVVHCLRSVYERVTGKSNSTDCARKRHTAD